MKNLLGHISILILSLVPGYSFAQKVLVEGTVVYKATLNNPDGSSKDGTYTITVKNKQVRKDLKIGNDFNNVTVLDEQGKSYILRSVNEKNFAVEMTGADFTQRNEKYYGAEVKEESDKRQIAGLQAQKATVKYKDGSSTVVYFTRDWISEMPYTFERFRGLKGFPLAFDYKNDQGAVIKFEAISFTESVVENTNFKVPAGYTLISNEEYRRLKTK